MGGDGVCYMDGCFYDWVILRTTNGGSDWVRQASGDTFSLHGVSFADADTGTAVGSGCDIFGIPCNDVILHTTNGGANWTPQSSGRPRCWDEPCLRAVSLVDADTGTAVGGLYLPPDNTILRTTDGGATWRRQGPPAGRLSGVSFVDATTGVAVGDYGTILQTTDGGATWTRQSSGTTEWLNGVSLVASKVTD